MFSALRNRIRVSPASVIATLALVFAMTGGAYAAGHFIITSTKQISPKVLKALKGKVGATGATGAQGPAGPTGATGPGGPQGPPGATGKEGAPGTEGAPGKEGKEGKTGFTKTLPSGESEHGQWGGLGGEGFVTTVSFNIPLGEETQAHFIGLEEGEGEPKEATAIKEKECGGTAAAPTAAPGNFCVFTSLGSNLGSALITNGEVTSVNPFNTGAGGSGALLLVQPKEAGAVEAGGPWVVTVK
jgi:hypothetical protein